MAGSLTLAVNVSSGQFVRRDFPAAVFRTLAKTGLPAQRLELEVTEEVAVDSNGSTRADIEVLQAHGIRISLGQFGTGLTSIANLKLLRIDKLKIDRSLIYLSVVTPEVERIVRGLVYLARGLELPVVAEGVETAAQATMLNSLNCDQAQGVFFGAPICGEEARRLMHSRRALQRLGATLTGVERVAKSSSFTQ